MPQDGSSTRNHELAYLSGEIRRAELTQAIESATTIRDETTRPELLITLEDTFQEALRLSQLPWLAEMSTG